MTIVQSELGRPSFISTAHTVREFRRDKQTKQPRPREKGPISQRPGARRKAGDRGTIRHRSPAKSSEQPNPLSIDPSTQDMRGNLFSPFPTLLEARGMTDVGGRLLERGQGGVTVSEGK